MNKKLEENQEDMTLLNYTDKLYRAQKNKTTNQEMFMEAEIKKKYEREYSNWQQTKELNSKLQKENAELKKQLDASF